MGFQIGIVRYRGLRYVVRPQGFGAGHAVGAVEGGRRDETDAGFLVDGADGFDAYGSMNILAEGRAEESKDAPGTYDIDVDDFGTDPEFMPLGQRYRECERAQRGVLEAQDERSGRCTSTWRASLSRSSGRTESSSAVLLDRIRDINHLDVRLHEFATELFEERMKESMEELEREKLPARLPI